jgi:ATP-binding cassette subfamily E protein 1
MADEKLTRIAIVNQDKCKPKKCRHECKRNCPVVRMGKLCIEVTQDAKSALISEPLCIGCGICVKKCPFEAIAIINLPKNLSKDTTHRYVLIGSNVSLYSIPPLCLCGPLLNDGC